MSLATRFAAALRLSLLAAPLLLAVAGCPGPEYPKCEKDDHCKQTKDGKEINEYCLFGQCQECAKDAHCDAGEACNRGRCETTCSGDEECGDGQMCEGATCVPVECSDAKACGGGQECNQGRCAAPAAAAAATTPVDNTGDVNCERSQTVRFDFNAAELRPDAREVLDNMAKCMSNNSDWRLTIEGHADERGTTEYNLQLGDRRAGSVKDYLVRLGVDGGRVKTISYGEERPIDRASTEDAWAQNRRSELVVQ